MNYEESPAFTELERAVLRLTDAMTSTPAQISDAIFNAVRTHLDEPQIVELSAAIAWENYRARFNRPFGLGAEGFSEGVFCPMPISDLNGYDVD